jgi:hypothetical protein
VRGAKGRRYKKLTIRQWRRESARYATWLHLTMTMRLGDLADVAGSTTKGRPVPRVSRCSKPFLTGSLEALNRSFTASGPPRSDTRRKRSVSRLARQAAGPRAAAGANR